MSYALALAKVLFSQPVPLTPEAQKIADDAAKWRASEIAKVKGKKMRSIDNVESWGDGHKTILGVKYTVTESDGAVYAVCRTGCTRANEAGYHDWNIPGCCESYERGLSGLCDKYMNCLVSRKLIKEAPPVPVSETQKMINTLTDQVKQLSAKLEDATKQQVTDTTNTQQLVNTINDLRKQLQDQQQLMLKMAQLVTPKT